MSRYDHKIETSLEGIEHLSKEIKLCQGIQDQSTQAMDRHTTLGPLQTRQILKKKRQNMKI